MHALRRLASRDFARPVVSDERNVALRRPWALIIGGGVFAFYLAFRLVQMLFWLVRSMF